MVSKIFYFAFVLAMGLAITSIDVFAQRGKSKSASKKVGITKKTVPTIDPNLPKVTQIDDIGLKNLLKREGENAKPLLINFWATWCGPCVEEFPELVEIDNHYKGKIDFITISIDDVADINTVVPRFLKKMNAGMPTYLLKTDDESAAIAMVDKDLSGALPITVLFDGTGKLVYKRQSKINAQVLRNEIDNLISPKAN